MPTKEEMNVNSLDKRIQNLRSKIVVNNRSEFRIVCIMSSSEDIAYR